MLPRRALGLSGMILVAASCSASNGVNGPGNKGGSAGSSTGSEGTGSSTGMGGSTSTDFTFPTTSSASGGSGGTTATATGGGGAGDGCATMPDPGVPAPQDACGDGLDNDLNGFVDEGCGCAPGQTQPCFGGPPSWLSLPNCTKGTQTCEGSSEFHGWGACVGWACGPVAPPAEVCGNGMDDDCDGLVDEGCELQLTVDIDGDCIYVSCPPQAPYPVGCNIIMDGGDSRGCVASSPTSSLVYFKEGDKCPLGLPFEDAGHVSGTLTCSTVPGTGLNDQNCPINKSTKYYPPNQSGCP